MRYIRNIFFILFINFVCILTLHAQDNKQADSLLFYLKSIRSAKDTDNIQKTIICLYKADETVLLNNNIISLLNNLQGKIGEDDYINLQSAYFDALINLNTTTANEKAIAVGKAFVAQYKNNGNKYAYYSYLGILRNIRLPLRNNGNVNELIRYYTQLDKDYHTINDSAVISIINNVLSGAYFRLGMLEKGQYYQLKSISYLDDRQLYYNLYSSAPLLGVAGKANRYAVLASYFLSENKTALADSFFNIALQLYYKLDSPLVFSDAPFLFLQMARCKTIKEDKNSAAYYDTALIYFRRYNSSPIEYAHFYQGKAADFISKNQLDSAMDCILQSKKLIDSFHLPVSSYMGELQPDYYMGVIFSNKMQPKKAIEYLQKDLAELKQFKFRAIEIRDLLLLANAYAADNRANEAYQTLQQALLLKEKIITDVNENRSMSFEIEKKMQENETTILLLDEQNRNNRKTKFYLIGIVSLFGLLALTLGVFYSNKRKSNRRLFLKNEKLALTLDKLKATQSQLIQSEKMASLGELTAGIAHEIQNPLNFVNNFSEVNAELIEEMFDEVKKGNTSEAEAIANDIKKNLEKINHHGKRADAIVKGMLQHSRTTSATKEPTDINKLADEYLRLAYHGLRAKDKSFNATLKTGYDESIGNIKIIPQDIGRVILNLITNAFYAVAEKKKQTPNNYEPIVTVSTKSFSSTSPNLPGQTVGRGVSITVSDNGNGIPKNILDKIFQPFFTTKPTGQGTGLGLSLAYDIVKAHGGEIKIETKVGEGTTFIIQLPINNA